MTTVAFIRHGLTDWNASKRIQGVTDIPLNEIGRAQARALANRFAQEKWDMIFTSDLSRASETAAIIGDALSVPLKVDRRVREIHFGQLEGTDEQERTERWGADWRRHDLGVEKTVKVLERGYDFLNEVLSEHHGKKILVVSHGAFIRDVLTAVLKEEEYDVSLLNTSVSILNYSDEKWECNLFNCDAHLKQIGV